MPTLQEYQASMSQKMDEQLGKDSATTQAAKELGQAAKMLQQGSLTELNQTQALASAVQAQMQATSMLIMQLQNGAGGGVPGMVGSPPMPTAPVPPPPAPSPFSGLKDFATNAGGAAFDMLKEGGIGLMGGAFASMKQAAHAGYQAGYNLFNAPGAATTGIAGHVSPLENPGVMVGTMRGLGFGYNPGSSQQYAFGAYQNAMNRNTSGRAADLARGGISLAGSMFSSAAIGAKLGGMAGPLGSLAGGYIGSKLESINPVSYGLAEMNRAVAFGERANHSAYGFLRGGGDTRMPGLFSHSQSGEIGLGIRRNMLSDLTYSDKNVGDAQMGFAETGQMLGVQTSQQYVERFRKQMDNMKAIMKTLNMAQEEAIGFMADQFNSVGYDHGAQMARFSSRFTSASHMSGMDPRSLMQRAIQGAQSFNQRGMLGTGGANIALDAASMAGMSATNNMPTNLLASVGGEEGLANLMAQVQGGFLSGHGGTLMALNRGGYGSIGGGIGGASRALGGSGGLVGLAANSHNMLEQAREGMGSQGTMVMVARELRELAKEFKGVGGSTQDRMKVIAQSQYGLNSVQADSLVKSLGALEETLKRDSSLQNKSFNTMLQDQVQERFGFKNSLRHGYRNFMETANFGGRSIDAYVNSANSFGSAVGAGAEALQDKITGIERYHITEGTAEALRKRTDVSSLSSRLGTRGGITENASSVAQFRKMRSDLKDRGWSTADELDTSAFRNYDIDKYTGGLMNAGSGTSVVGDAQLALSHFAITKGKGGSNRDDIVKEFKKEYGLGQYDNWAESTQMKDYIQKNKEGIYANAMATTASDATGNSRADIRNTITESFSERHGVKSVSGPNTMQEALDSAADTILDHGMMSSLSKAQAEASLADPRFKSFIQALNEAMKSFKPSARGGQSQEYMDAEAKVAALYEKEVSTDPTLKKAVDRFMGKRNVSIKNRKLQLYKFGEAGIFDGDKGLSADQRYKKRLSGLNLEGALGKLDQVSQFAQDKASTKVVSRFFDAQSKSLGGIESGGAFDEKTGSIDFGMLGRSYMGMSEDDMRTSFESGNETQRKMLSKIAQAKQGSMSAQKLGEELSKIALSSTSSGDLITGERAKDVLREGGVGAESLGEILKGFELQNQLTSDLLEQMRRS